MAVFDIWPCWVSDLLNPELKIGTVGKFLQRQYRSSLNGKGQGSLVLNRLERPVLFSRLYHRIAVDMQHLTSWLKGKYFFPVIETSTNYFW